MIMSTDPLSYYLWIRCSAFFPVVIFYPIYEKHQKQTKQCKKTYEKVKDICPLMLENLQKNILISTRKSSWKFFTWLNFLFEPVSKLQNRVGHDKIRKLI